jgi:hypothetical protein
MLCINELHNLEAYSSQNIIRMIKSRRMKGAGHVARMGRWGMPVFVRIPESMNHFGEAVVID